MRSFNQMKPPVVLLVESPDANALADCSIAITGKRPDDDHGTGWRNLQYQPSYLPAQLCRDCAIKIASIQFLYTTV